MSDFMASALATFLHNRTTNHHHHNTPETSPPPPFISPLSSYHVLHPPLQPPPLPKTPRSSSLTFSHLLNHDPSPVINTIPAPLQPHHLTSTSLQSPGPMIAGIPLLNSTSTHSTPVRTSSSSKTTTPRPFACRHQACSASFIKQNHLSRHIRIVHNKERPYRCAEPGCASRFGSKSHLGDHTRAVHMRIKLFKCEMCNASWSKRFNLKKHIRVRHLGEKPFRCQQCQLSFGTRSHATRHELKVHKRSFADGLPDSNPNVCT